MAFRYRITLKSRLTKPLKRHEMTAGGVKKEQSRGRLLHVDWHLPAPDRVWAGDGAGGAGRLAAGAFAAWERARQDIFEACRRGPTRRTSSRGSRNATAPAPRFCAPTPPRG